MQMENTGFVIPAQAGIQVLEAREYLKIAVAFQSLDSRLRGNDGG